MRAGAAARCLCDAASMAVRGRKPAPRPRRRLPAGVRKSPQTSLRTSPISPLYGPPIASCPVTCAGGAGAGPACVQCAREYLTMAHQNSRRMRARAVPASKNKQLLGNIFHTRRHANSTGMPSMPTPCRHTCQQIDRGTQKSTSVRSVKKCAGNETQTQSPVTRLLPCTASSPRGNNPLQLAAPRLEPAATARVLLKAAAPSGLRSCSARRCLLVDVAY
jgi:hypothetical protein